MMPLEVYLRTVFAFFQAVCNGAVLNLPHEQDALLSFLLLSANGTWEISATFPDPLALGPVNGITIPLVLPLSLIILVAHVETQWARGQEQVGMVSLPIW